MLTYNELRYYSTDLSCDFHVSTHDKNSMYSSIKCKYKPTFKVFFKYGTKHYCTRHKNIMLKDKCFLKAEEIKGK